MLKSAPKQEKDPDGRMPLGDHLRELRNRLMKAVLAILVVTIVAAFFYKDLINFLNKPILDAVGCVEGKITMKNGQPCADMTTNGLLAPFTIALKVSLMAGVVLSTPIWLYQLWAFLAPGLHRTEKRYAISFVVAGVPLFLLGGYIAYNVLPQTATVLLDFSPDNVRNLLPVDDLLDLIMRMIIVFGLAFELPLLLVLLNLTRVLTGKRMLGWWRGMVLGITIFAAVATPGGDPLSMCLLAAPMVLLYFIAAGISLLNDKRRRAADPDAELDDDEASDVDLTPDSVGAIEQVPAARALPEQASGDTDGPAGRNGFDDAT
ncbi:twin-arginine translocase subunit TatC [Streptomyces sp. H27-D2]|uniref:twin-arginine translocase subunit TatC n=1 Tax=Streptomyces sp. H27-D2 TaxID=3046304 RepID=UPI002DBFF90D|nr:twin-arginine translocase subunit TatC [Streptomyces sp. H27-D2]MEC4016662.1 twin-arginine translocase subunit TatC [Streptomyces sp. H27-D2]